MDTFKNLDEEAIKSTGYVVDTVGAVAGGLNEMFDRREKNAEIFRDTEYLYKNNETLKEVVNCSVNNQKLLLANEKVEYEATGD